jgi:hypothetical protein
MQKQELEYASKRPYPSRNSTMLTSVKAVTIPARASDAFETTLDEIVNLLEEGRGSSFIFLPENVHWFNRPDEVTFRDSILEKTLEQGQQ